jgi:nucleotide-binding universal stress UspA family protein
MLKLLVYTDGKPAAAKALEFAAVLKKRLESELAVITIRSGTDATEDPPPVGIEFPLTDRDALPKGLQILIDAIGVFESAGLMHFPRSIRIQDIARGHLFACRTIAGERVAFYECFGHFIDSLNHEIERHQYNLLIISPQSLGKLQRLVTGDPVRKLALDLHTSVLVVRGGEPDSRYVICADGSPSAQRQFPLLKGLLLSIRGPVDLVWVKKPNAGQQDIEAAETCLRHAWKWLETCGKTVTVHRLEGSNLADLLVDAAGDSSVIVMGASLRHDVYRRMLGSLPMQVLAKSRSSILLVKLPPEADGDFMNTPFSC